MSKRTLILGASNNPERYAFRAAMALKRNGHDFVPFGVKKGEVAGKIILNDFPGNEEIDTVTLYVNPKLQEQYYQDIIKLQPKRIIFNPGTENNELRNLAEDAGIETEYACTLVLLASGQY